MSSMETATPSAMFAAPTTDTLNSEPINYEILPQEQPQQQQEQSTSTSSSSSLSSCSSTANVAAASTSIAASMTSIPHLLEPQTNQSSCEDELSSSSMANQEDEDGGEVEVANGAETVEGASSRLIGSDLDVQLACESAIGAQVKVLEVEEEENCSISENRLERSNSCSQAETASLQLGGSPMLAANAATTSLSHENLPLAESTTNNCGSLGRLVASSDLCEVRPNPGQSNFGAASAQTDLQIPQKQQQQQQQQFHSNFFSSKLNTGSLWSLLGSSSNCTNPASEMAANKNLASKYNPDGANQRPSSNSNSNPSAGFFSRAQFKRQAQSQDGHQIRLLPSSENAKVGGQSQQQVERRFRFNVRYIGSAILHKSFTLPMLEWIARDIKRQTVKGAQSTSQRQFNIPAREIVLEIHSYQLNAISCKDGHPIFVHSMHRVSKYAQLQHDPTCFSYLIRDNKDSPNFCHVFQAKSANKVHDIFSAIREATTRTQMLTNSQQTPPVVVTKPFQPSATLPAAIQKSASIDGQLRGKQQQQQQQQQQQVTDYSGSPPLAGANYHQPSLVAPMLTISSAARSQQQVQAAAASASNQFENSYQFEVMFVKKVKLQCRRVPATFVDDALETLKSFEVLKGGDLKAKQIKGVGKRIINASVDERQEYDEAACQSPTGSINPLRASVQMGETQAKLNAINPIHDAIDQRRGSSASLKAAGGLDNQLTALIRGETNEETIRKGERESRSCQQSPTKSPLEIGEHEIGTNLAGAGKSASNKETSAGKRQHYQSLDCLKDIDSTIRSARDGNAPNYSNDFSPYNTITSSDLNERIAAIPVVSSSVSLDHEMRQKLARQVRETIMATAATIKKGVYASGDQLDSSSSSKALDSLSCTSDSSVPPPDQVNVLELGPFDCGGEPAANEGDARATKGDTPNESHKSPSANIHGYDHRRSSAASTLFQHQQQQPSAGGNNFDLFRRASARQVVKNRTMLLLIGKDELCTISIDKHQMLFSKSFNSIVHCLQGNNNRDHFGLICRDSGKINPNAESYAGFIFKCQSDKVVREIMGALKQVIYSSQHNYHGFNSPYNPLNTVSVNHQHQYNGAKPSLAGKKALEQPMGCKQQQMIDDDPLQPQRITNSVGQQRATPTIATTSLAAKRGFVQPIELDEAAKMNQRQTNTGDVAANSTASAGTCNNASSSNSANTFLASAQPKNLIKSMFCDGCPLYWYHRLCCDIESLPAEASKAIILRRIDSSLTESEQDELYSRFSEFNIDSIDEHNEIFMSLLRHQCERKQLKHSQSRVHQAAMTKQNPALINTGTKSATTAKQVSTPIVSAVRDLIGAKGITIATPPITATSSTTTSNKSTSDTSKGPSTGHQRSGSSSGPLNMIIGQPNQSSAATATIADAGSAAIDNFKRAKNSISSSIENLLKRRSSMRDEFEDSSQEIIDTVPARSGSFRSSSRDSRAAQSSNNDADQQSQASTNLKRSQSTSDYPYNQQQQQQQQQSNFTSVISWRDSLRRNLQDDSSTNPLANLLFRRRSSTFGSKSGDLNAADGEISGQVDNSSKQNLVECLQNQGQDCANLSPAQPGSPSLTDSRFSFANAISGGGGGASPSSVLSSTFWKKSIFDKIRKPIAQETGESSAPIQQLQNTNASVEISSNADANQEQRPEANCSTPKRTREELRSLWRKAIAEQITLLKMDKQNQRLIANTAECDNQRIKLNYRDVIYARDVPSQWDKLLKQDPTKKVEFFLVAKLVRLGVPKQRRGEVWMFLMNQYQLRHGNSFQPADSEYQGDSNQMYRNLLSQLSVQQHEIFVDIGRTFPTHPYYSQYLSIGQLSLFNLLKAYSLLDQEVGYCQGLSFVAGILLLHVDSEDEAFELMRHLLFNFGLRKQYLPSMNALHLQLYQITRLLRDHEYDLFNHFDNYDISPSLYAAPWFLTLFASQFPLGFVARLFDLIFLIGIEAIFRVSLNLLAYHRASILSCKSLESTMDFLRYDLVNIEDKNIVKIFDKSLSLDLRNNLIEYEIEYTFYCAEDRSRSAYGHLSSSQNSALQKNNSSQQSATTNNPNNLDGTKKIEHNLDSSTSVVADATATVIIQHILANNHLKSLMSNYSY